MGFSSMKNFGLVLLVSSKVESVNDCTYITYGTLRVNFTRTIDLPATQNSVSLVQFVSRNTSDIKSIVYIQMSFTLLLESAQKYTFVVFMSVVLFYVQECSS